MTKWWRGPTRPGSTESKKWTQMEPLVVKHDIEERTMHMQLLTQKNSRRRRTGPTGTRRSDEHCNSRKGSLPNSPISSAANSSGNGSETSRLPCCTTCWN